jgi:HK97 family phage major capsid protein
MTTVEKRQKRAAIYEQIKALNAQAKEENRSFTAEENQKWDKMKADLDKFDSEIKREEFILEEERKNATVEGNHARDEEIQVEAREAFDNYLKRGEGGLKPEERRALEQRAATDPNSTTDGEGGYTVPDMWSATIERVMKQYGGVLANAQVINMSKGGVYNHPVINDTTNVGAIVGEGVADAVNQFTDTNVQILDYTYTSRIIQMTLELVQDTNYPLTQTVLELCAERIGRILNTHLTTGTGTAQPFGVVTGSTLGNTAAATAAITRAELVDLIYSVDRAYRSNGKLMLHDSTVAAIQKLDIGSADARPLWAPSMREGAPNTILGYEYITNNDMPELGASNKAVLFGDFSKYVVKQVRTPELVTFREKYMDKRCVGYNMFARYGGKIVNDTAIKHLICAAV